MVWVIAGEMTRTVFQALLWLVLMILVGSALMLQICNHLESEAIEQRRSGLLADAEYLAGMLAGDQRFLQEVGERRFQNYYYEFLDRRPVLDGSDDDWNDVGKASIDSSLRKSDGSAAISPSFDIKLAADDDFLYLHYRVSDDTVVYREVDQSSVHRSDHIQISLIDHEGQYRRFSLATERPGHLEAIEVGRDQTALRVVEEIAGRWLATEDGYNVELQIPRKFLINRFSTVIADVDDVDQEPCCYFGESDTMDVSALGYLAEKPTPLEKIISNLPWSTSLSDGAGRLLVRSEYWPETDFVGAAAPIMDDQLMLGEISLRQTNHPLRRVCADRKFLIGVLMIGVLVLVVLGGWYSFHRLRRNDSKLRTEVDRITRYNEYLERMASRLNHELQTPISVISSSLEQIESRSGSDKVYVERASEGLRRLSNIIVKMSEARRLEEALDEDEIVRFNLAEAVKGCVEGYRLAFPGQVFEMKIEAEDVPVTGIPELIAQCLDKIVDNAVEFSTAPTIRVSLSIEDNQALVRVMNEGPELPAARIGSLFESMVSVRQPGVDHLGLGLYVAKTIIEYHGGEITLKNNDDLTGVVTAVRLPILRLTAKLFHSR